MIYRVLTKAMMSEKHFGGKAKVRLLFEGDKFKLKR